MTIPSTETSIQPPLRFSQAKHTCKWQELALIIECVATLIFASAAFYYGVFWPSIAGFGISGIFLLSAIAYTIKHSPSPSKGEALPQNPTFVQDENDPVFIGEDLGFGSSSSDSEEFPPHIFGLSAEVNGRRPFTRQKNTRDASKVPGNEEEKPKNQVEEDALSESSSSSCQVNDAENSDLNIQFDLPSDEESSSESESSAHEEGSGPFCFEQLEEEMKTKLMNAGIPVEPLKARLNSPRLNPDYRTSRTDKKYAYHRTVEDKLSVQLDESVRRAYEEFPKNFKVDLTKKVDQFIDKTIQDPSIGAAECQNSDYRPSMEDVHFIAPLKFHLYNGEIVEAKLICVCDGHGDHKIAGKYLFETLPGALQGSLKELDDETITNTLTALMVDCDKAIQLLLNDKGLTGGTTLTGALVFAKKILIFNVGDSRTILIKDDISKIFQLTEDSKPNAPRFKHAIQKENMMIHGQYVMTKKGGVATARDLGMIFPRPKFSKLEIGSEEDNLTEMKIYFQTGNYLVHACDGLWNEASTEEVGLEILRMHQAGKTPAEMAGHLVEAALQRSKDNVTVVVVKVG